MDDARSSVHERACWFAPAEARAQQCFNNIEVWGEMRDANFRQAIISQAPDSRLQVFQERFWIEVSNAGIVLDFVNGIFALICLVMAVLSENKYALKK